MKVSLYTIFRCTNYGAVLQAYALASTLRGILGESAVDVVNHRMDPRDNHLLGKITNPNTPWLQRWRNRRKFSARYHLPEMFEARREKTIRLIEDAIRPTQRLYKSPAELKELPPCSTVIVGSDQVWNPALNHDFGHNQYLATDLPDGQDRVAYAASFGVSELPESCRAEYRSALSRFRRITVREETGARIVRELLGEGAPCPEVVLDPTMLLSADVWRTAVSEDRQPPSSRFLAAYWVRTLTQADVDALARIARDAGLPVRLMSAGPLPRLDFPGEVIPCVDADPFDFVRTVDGSSGVVTDSFHGLQFATLFCRPFLALGDLSDRSGNASRLVDFCGRYGLKRCVADISLFRGSEGGALRCGDFSDFDGKALDADRLRSIDALKGLLA